MGLLSRALTLTPSEGRALAEATQALWRVRRRLRGAGFAAIREECEALAATGQELDARGRELLRVCEWAVKGVGRRMRPPARCLEQSLALQRMVARRGYRTELRIGVERAEGLEAHAWLEAQGEAVFGAERGLGQYARLEPPARGKQGGGTQ